MPIDAHVGPSPSPITINPDSAFTSPIKALTTGPESFMIAELPQ
jgi:hypothetical protein